MYAFASSSETQTWPIMHFGRSDERVIQFLVKQPSRKCDVGYTRWTAKKNKKFNWNVSKRKQLLTLGTVFLGNVIMVLLAANRVNSVLTSAAKKFFSCQFLFFFFCKSVISSHINPVSLNKKIQPNLRFEVIFLNSLL